MFLVKGKLYILLYFYVCIEVIVLLIFFFGKIKDILLYVYVFEMCVDN